MEKHLAKKKLRRIFKYPLTRNFDWAHKGLFLHYIVFLSLKFYKTSTTCSYFDKYIEKAIINNS